MAAPTYSFIIEQGSTWDQLLNYKDSAGVLIDLSEYTASMELRTNYLSDSGTYVVSPSCSIETTQGSTVKGTIRMKLNASQTAALNFTQPVYYDLEVASGSEASAASRYVVRLLRGKIKLSKEVTSAG